MTNRDIYEAALSLLAEEQAEDCEDYEARAPHILAGMINECSELHESYRISHGGEAIACAIVIDLDEDFPLHARFCSAAAMYLAAQLVEIEDAELSDRLFARYAEEVRRIGENIGVGGSIGSGGNTGTGEDTDDGEWNTGSWTCEPIRDVYGFYD